MNSYPEDIFGSEYLRKLDSVNLNDKATFLMNKRVDLVIANLSKEIIITNRLQSIYSMSYNISKNLNDYEIIEDEQK